MIDEGVLAERNILNTAELNNIRGIREDWAARFLNDTVICDIDMVRVINALCNKATEEEEDIEHEDD